MIDDEWGAGACSLSLVAGDAMPGFFVRWGSEMKRFASCYVVLLAALLSGVCVRAYSSSLWDEFLRDPDEGSLIVLENAIGMCQEACSPCALPSKEQVPLLFELVGKGNTKAFLAGLSVSRCFHASYSEDFSRSAGAFFEMRPLIFLRAVKEKAVQDWEIKLLFTMLPLDTVDNLDQKISVVENRIAILNSIDDPSVVEVKEKGLYFLKKKETVLRRS